MRRAQPHGHGTWSTPGGYLEPGETFENLVRGRGHPPPGSGGWLGAAGR